MTARGFPGLDLRTFYHGEGEDIVREFVIPVLAQSTSYDRLTGYFNVNGLIGVAPGLEELFRNEGTMRLVIGIHDVPSELLAAIALGEVTPDSIVQEYRSRLLTEVGFLKSEARRSSLASFAWMMRLGLLKVVIAAPRSASGIFHQKRMIFRDKFGNIIAGTGSLNETGGGHQNAEEMLFQFSWLGSKEAWSPLVEDFERVWSGTSDGVAARPLDATFASEMLERLGQPANPFEHSRAFGDLDHELRTAERLIDYGRETLALAALNSSNASLYPHQERVFLETLSTLPVRKILGDEVGLGKTLEAGTIISYLLRVGVGKSVAILSPAGLMGQWQSEMSMHFGLEFWRWDSTRRAYVDSEGSAFAGLANGSGQHPPLRIISAQWARLNHREVEGQDIDLLVVDEAHAARTRRDAYGDVRRTKLWRLIESLSSRVPHILLLTATPMQLDPIEYHGLLQLLGLNEYWQDFNNYELSLRLLSSEDSKPSLQTCLRVSEMLGASIGNLSAEDLRDQSGKEFLDTYRREETATALDRAFLVRANFDSARRLLVESHPGHRLIVRNTKSGLARFGYFFPHRVFHSPTVSLAGPLAHYEQMVSTYLADAYGRVEDALAGGLGARLGFAKSTYYQRLVSSLSASQMSLIRRRDKLESIKQLAKNGEASVLVGVNLGDEDVEEIDLDEDADANVLTPAEIADRLQMVAAEAQVELAYVGQLLKVLDSLPEGVPDSDPKFMTALEVIESAIHDDRVLVFSRYTDTINAFIDYYLRCSADTSSSDIAKYTGSDVWIERNGIRLSATKKEVVTALTTSQIQIVFCSDAASEGLNLQAARVLINLDVPWNPARLEQRIGRIARLGQRAASVDIHNLWYPQSIEARMYNRLLSRRDQYQLAVGEFPEIFSQAIAREVRLALGVETGASDDPFELLTEVRNTSQRIALEELWKAGDVRSPLSTDFRSRLHSALGELPVSRQTIRDYSVEPGRDDSLCLWSPVFDLVRDLPLPPDSVQAFALEETRLGDWSVGLCIRGASGMTLRIDSKYYPETLVALVSGAPLPSTCVEPMSSTEYEGAIASARDTWLPAVPMRVSPAADSRGLVVSYRRLGFVNLPKSALSRHED